jgi:hypothetical protein
MFKEMQTVPEAIAVLEKVVELKGADYVYDAETLGNMSGECQYAYVDNEGTVQPGCIVGYAVYTTEGQEVLEDLHRDADPRTYGVDDIAPVNLDNDVIKVLLVAQNLQDSGKPWGVALQGAKLAAAELGYNA